MGERAIDARKHFGYSVDTLEERAMTAYDEGFRAFSENIPMIGNPYDKYSGSWYSWNDGWKQNWFTTLQASNRRMENG